MWKWRATPRSHTSAQRNADSHEEAKGLHGKSFTRCPGFWPFWTPSPPPRQPQTTREQQPALLLTPCHSSPQRSRPRCFTSARFPTVAFLEERAVLCDWGSCFRWLPGTDGRLHRPRDHDLYLRSKTATALLKNGVAYLNVEMKWAIIQALEIQVPGGLV